MKRVLTTLLLVVFVLSLGTAALAADTAEIGTNWWPQLGLTNSAFVKNADGSLSTVGTGNGGNFNIACGNPAQPTGDMTIEMELKPIDLTGNTLIGCVIGTNNPNDLFNEGIHVQISKDGGIKLFDVVPNEVALTGVPAYGTSWVKIKFVIAGGKLDFYVNGTKVLDQHTLLANPSGKWIIIGAGGIPSGTTADFRNIVITAGGTTYQNFMVAATPTSGTNPSTSDAGSIAGLLALAVSAGALTLLRKRRS